MATRKGNDGETLAPEPTDDVARPSGTQTLERGLDLLDLIVEQPIRMPDVIARSGLTKATVWRLVNTLINRNLVFLNERGELQGGTKLLELGARTQSRIDVLALAAPALDELAARTGFAAFLGRREGDHSVHLHRSASNQRVIVATPPGTRRLLAETSLGRALMIDDGPDAWQRAFAAVQSSADASEWLEQMYQSRSDGVVINKGGAPDFVNAVAAPIRDASGRIVAALSIASPAQYLDSEQLRATMPIVAETARSVSAMLGYL